MTAPVIYLFLILLQATLATSQECLKLQNSNYTLFGDQTLYDTARAHLNNASTYLAASFGDLTLEEEHQRLVANSSGCRPISLFYVGRNAASFPHGQQIEDLTESLLTLQDRLRSKRRHKCPEKVQPFLDWVPLMTPEMGDQVTLRGLRQQRAIARRFKRLYPSLFNVRESEVRLGVTKAIKTAQSAGQFLAEIEGWKFPGCQAKSLDVNGTLDSELQQQLRSNSTTTNRCYERLIYKNRLPYQLEFDKLCKQFAAAGQSAADEPKEDPMLDQIEDPLVTRRMAKRLSDRLRLVVDEETLLSVYEMCVYETSLGAQQQSVWCSLFTEKELKQLEYVRDVISFARDAYGPRVKPKQACPLISDMMETFEELGNKVGEKLTKRSYFYFTQKGAFEKLLADFGLFYDEQSNSDDRLAAFLSHRARVPLQRDWRSSVIVPQSANLALALYSCPGNRNKLLGSVTEWPVLLPGCKDVACDLDDFLASFSDLRDCNLKEVCTPPPTEEKKKKKKRKNQNREDPPKEKKRKRRKKKKPEEEDYREPEHREEEEEPRRREKRRRQHEEEEPRQRPPPYINRKGGTLTIVYN